MPLTHVCVWDSKIGYRRVTIEEARKIHPHGARASSGFFVCELCAQNVCLTAPGVNVQHFRHDSAAQTKACIDRQMTLGSPYTRLSAALNSYIIPLHLSVSESSNTFSLGFFFPSGVRNYCDRLKIYGDSHQMYEYSIERIEEIATTYLQVGSIPSLNYWIEYINANTKSDKLWPTKLSGINKVGSLFDGRTGRILQSGGKAYSGNFYYLLQRHPLYLCPSEIDAKEISRTQTNSFTTWYLYKICTKQFSENAARFFLKYAIFLTEKPTKIYPVWPPYIKDPYFIYHNSSNFFFYLCGDDAELVAYPAATNVISTLDGRLYKLYTSGREQVVSLGKSGALGFSYLIKQPLNKKAAQPKLTIKDFSGAELIEDSYTKLPKSKYILVSCQYNGKAIVRRGQKIEHIYKISSEQDLLIDGLSLGTEICFFHGCDCIRTIRFEQPQIDTSTTELDRVLIAKLQTCTGPTVSIPHSFGSLVRKYESFPQTKKWLYTALRQGAISRKALRILISDIPNKHRRDIND